MAGSSRKSPGRQPGTPSPCGRPSWTVAGSALGWAWLLFVCSPGPAALCLAAYSCHLILRLYVCLLWVPRGITSSPEPGLCLSSCCKCCASTWLSQNRLSKPCIEWIKGIWTELSGRRGCNHSNGKITEMKTILWVSVFQKLQEELCILSLEDSELFTTILQ